MDCVLCLFMICLQGRDIQSFKIVPIQTSNPCVSSGAGDCFGLRPRNDENKKPLKMRGDTRSAYHLSSLRHTSAEVGTVVSGCRSVTGSVPQLLWMSKSVNYSRFISRRGTSCQIKIRLTIACFTRRLSDKEILNRNEKSRADQFI